MAERADDELSSGDEDAFSDGAGVTTSSRGLGDATARADAEGGASNPSDGPVALGNCRDDMIAGGRGEGDMVSLTNGLSPAAAAAALTISKRSLKRITDGVVTAEKAIGAARVCDAVAGTSATAFDAAVRG